ncbi:MAG: formylglycine-generating enzyme family protein [Panacagrimonas sp.]
MAAPNPGPVAWRDCADSPELIRLRGNRFRMGELGSTGTLYEKPVREVAVSEFSIGKYEVTFDEWDQCHLAGGCLNPADDEGWGRGRRPVVNVSWVDAQQYVHWLSTKTGRRYRLPTEAEWEYAARAGTTTRYHWGDGAEWACTTANVFDLTGYSVYPNWHWRATCDDNFATSAPVGSFEPNHWGLHDMNGNVWEWVQDCWHSDYTGAPRDSSAWITGGDCGKRVNRGGGWGNNPRSMRSASRDADSAEGHSNAMGFRIARSP